MRDDRHRDLTNLIDRARTVEALDDLERATAGELTADLRVMLAKRRIACAAKGDTDNAKNR